MSTNAFVRSLKEADAQPVTATAFIARRAFGFQDRASKKVVQVAQGERVPLEVLRDNCDIRKLIRVGYLARADES